MSNIVYAQSDMPRKNSITWSPFRLADPVNPGLELGFERLHNKKYATHISAAYMNNFFDIHKLTNYRGIRLSAEERYFVPFGPEFSKNYMAVEFVYLNVKYPATATFSKDTSLSAPTYADSFKVAKQTLALNLKFGFRLDTRIKGLYVDFSVGAGLKYKMAKRSGLLDPDSFEETPRNFNAYFSANKGGNYFTGNVPVNIRVLYNF